jgi:predicted permease
MHNFLHDCALVLRKLRRSPGFALTTILTLTIALVANVVVFGVVHALLFQPLPAAQPDRLFQVQGKNLDDLTLSYPNYTDIRDRNHTFSDVTAYRLARVGLAINGVAAPVWGYEATGNYFNMLGVKPLLGRFYTPAEDAAPSGSPVVVLSYACWKARFAGDSQIVGKTVFLNKLPYSVLGVAPKEFNGTERFLWPELWVPYRNQPLIEGFSPAQFGQYRGNDNTWVVGRLKDGVTQAKADADLNRVAAQLAQDYPAEDKAISLRTAKPGLLGDALGEPARGFLLGVMMLASLVLIAACANLGGLFAARTADRSKEMGIRLAIGSSKGKIAQQLLAEALVIALISGVAASWITTALLQGLTRWHPANLEVPIQFQVLPGFEVYLFASALVLLATVLFGLIPARQVWKTDPNQTLRGVDAGQGKSRFTGRSLMLVVQVALCCLLVTASFVSVRGLQKIFTMPLGMQPEKVTIATLDPHLGGYQGEAVAVVQQRMLNAAREIPGVTGAAYANTTPLSTNNSNSGVFAPGTTDFSMANAKFNAQSFNVSTDYFKVAGTRLLAGRAFTEHDDAKAPPVVIVNATFAKRLFGTVDAVGKHYPGGSDTEYEIVGVVEDGKYRTLTEDQKPAMFWPTFQRPSSDTVLLVRSERNTQEMTVALRQAIAKVDGNVPVFNLSSWQDALSLVTLPARIATIALGILGVLAVMLAFTGIFGLANYAVSRRMREFGIRVALGAQQKQVLQAALGRIALLITIGCVAGLLLGVAASRLLASIVYDAKAADPLVIFAVVITMAALGLLSGMIPARRALRVEPAMLLRSE